MSEDDDIEAYWDVAKGAAPLTPSTPTTEPLKVLETFLQVMRQHSRVMPRTLPGPPSAEIHFKIVDIDGKPYYRIELGGEWKGNFTAVKSLEECLAKLQTHIEATLRKNYRLSVARLLELDSQRKCEHDRSQALEEQLRLFSSCQVPLPGELAACQEQHPVQEWETPCAMVASMEEHARTAYAQEFTHTTTPAGVLHFLSGDRRWSIPANQFNLEPEAALVERLNAIRQESESERGEPGPTEMLRAMEIEAYQHPGSRFMSSVGDSNLIWYRGSSWHLCHHRLPTSTYLGMLRTQAGINRLLRVLNAIASSVGVGAEIRHELCTHLSREVLDL